jgi:hypothetical protein
MNRQASGRAEMFHHTCHVKTIPLLRQVPGTLDGTWRSHMCDYSPGSVAFVLILTVRAMAVVHLLHNISCSPKPGSLSEQCVYGLDDRAIEVCSPTEAKGFFL